MSVGAQHRSKSVLNNSFEQQQRRKLKTVDMSSMCMFGAKVVHFVTCVHNNHKFNFWNVISLQFSSYTSPDWHDRCHMMACSLMPSLDYTLHVLRTSGEYDSVQFFLLNLSAHTKQFLRSKTTNGLHTIASTVGASTEVVHLKRKCVMKHATFFLVWLRECVKHIHWIITIWSWQIQQNQLSENMKEWEIDQPTSADVQNLWWTHRSGKDSKHGEHVASPHGKHGEHVASPHCVGP